MKRLMTEAAIAENVNPFIDTHKKQWYESARILYRQNTT